MNEVYQFHALKAGSFSAAVTQKIFPCSPSNGQQPTSNGGAFTAAVALSGRRLLLVTNEDATITIRFGDSSIASLAGGTPIYARQSMPIWVTAEVPVYVVADSGTPLVSWNEYA